LVLTRRTAAAEEIVILDKATDSKMIPLSVGPFDLPKEALAELIPQFAEALARAISVHACHSLVIHSHYWLLGVTVYQAANLPQVTVIHTMRTLGATKNSAIPGSEPLHRIEAETLICAHAQVLIANTADEKQELIKFSGVRE